MPCLASPDVHAPERFRPGVATVSRPILYSPNLRRRGRAGLLRALAQAGVQHWRIMALVALLFARTALAQQADPPPAARPGANQTGDAAGAEQPAAEQSAAKQSAAEQPATEQPAAMEPAAAQSEGAPTASTQPAAGATPQDDSQKLETIEVVSHRLNEARTTIETQLGASVYQIDADAIAAMPGGDNGLLNQALLQAPEVTQDSFGQVHIRGEHNGLQYRLNGIILPEGISAFGQSLDPRLISSMQIITGALPAEYGLRTAGIIDMTTKSGALDPGGAVSIYGGSHGTIEPSLAYGGSAGRFHYFVSLDGLQNKLGIESPDGSATPLHDASRQVHGFAYLEQVIDGGNRASLILSAAGAGFQIPDRRGIRPGIQVAPTAQNPSGAVALSVNGQTAFDSALLNETQREQTQFAIASWQHSSGPFDFLSSATVRNSTLQFTPDPLGDLLFNGISQSAYKRNLAYDWQGDGAYKLDDAHTLRAGWFVQQDTSTSLTGSQVLALVNGQQPLPLQPPETILDDNRKTEHIESLYLQDEWTLRPTLTVNGGLRFDTFRAYASATQFSPRLSVVWQPAHGTTVHAGFARYLTPPPFELVGAETIARFAGTSAAPLVMQADTPRAERANYLDVGMLQILAQNLSLGLDSYFKRSSQLIDEGQFGAPIILTPFNYAAGRQAGVEATLNYAGRNLSIYANLAWQTALGRDIDTAQFNFSPADLAYIGSHAIDLDHEQKVTASGGASYHWGDTRLSADFLLGSGLRASLVLPDGTDIPNGRHLPYYSQLNLGSTRVVHLEHDNTLTLRFDVLNVFDRVYEIRDGTGVGVGAPQFGARRGLFVGLARSL